MKFALKGTASDIAEKLDSSGFREGHGFSRAVDDTAMPRLLAPEVRFFHPPIFSYPLIKDALRG
jgi:hypothetical protein